MEGNAIVVDLSVIVNALSNRKSIKPKTFGELMSLSRESVRLDIVTDTYPEGMNLKEQLQVERGVGKRMNFHDDTDFPSDFASDFLRNSENKRNFYPYLIDKIMTK